MSVRHHQRHGQRDQRERERESAHFARLLSIRPCERVNPIFFSRLYVREREVSNAGPRIYLPPPLPTNVTAYGKAGGALSLSERVRLGSEVGWIGFTQPSSCEIRDRWSF
jgi:hypothetical protein